MKTKNQITLIRSQKYKEPSEGEQESGARVSSFYKMDDTTIRSKRIILRVQTTTGILKTNIKTMKTNILGQFCKRERHCHILNQRVVGAQHPLKEKAVWPINQSTESKLKQHRTSSWGQKRETPRGQERYSSSTPSSKCKIEK